MFEEITSLTSFSSLLNALKLWENFKIVWILWDHSVSALLYQALSFAAYKDVYPVCQERPTRRSDKFGRSLSWLNSYEP